MPKTKISEFSATPANNTDIDSINISEGCAPSGINDAIRELMAQLKDFQTGAVGDSFNGPVGTTTAAAGAFTTLSSTGNTTLGDASGDSVTINGTATFANANPTLSAGTANGVAYLNGSKVVTSGSALTFSGSALSVTGSIASTTGITNTNTNSTLNSNLSAVSDVVRTDVLSYGSTDSSALFGTTRASYSVLLSQSGNGMMLGNFNNTPIIFGVNNAEQMRLTSTGLGIGTSSPAYKLDVRASSTPTIRVLETTNGPDGRFLASSSDVQIGTYGGSPLSFYTNSSEKMKLDTSGNLGLGVTPSAWAFRIAQQIGAAASISAAGGSNSSLAEFGANRYLNSSGNEIYIGNNYATLYQQVNGVHAWYNAPSGTAGNAITFTQALTLDSSGWLYLGTTSTSTAGNAIVAYANSVAGQFSIGHANGTSSGNNYVGFQYNGSTIGSITQSGTTAVLYNVTSDKRLKNDLGVVTSTDVIANTVIHDFIWKSDGSQSRGVFAQEATKVIPSAVKVGDDGEEVTDQWQVDYSKYIPDIIVELQSLRKRIAELEAK